MMDQSKWSYPVSIQFVNLYAIYFSLQFTIISQYDPCLFITVVFDNLINVLFDVSRHNGIFSRDRKDKQCSMTDSSF